MIDVLMQSAADTTLTTWIAIACLLVMQAYYTWPHDPTTNKVLDGD